MRMRCRFWSPSAKVPLAPEQVERATNPGGEGLRRPQAELDGEIGSGEPDLWMFLHMDRLRFRFLLGHRDLGLTKSEYDILAYLVGCCPRVVSPREIVDNVLGTHVDDRTVKQHVHNIRRKINTENGRDTFLRCTRSRGFWLDEGWCPRGGVGN